MKNSYLLDKRKQEVTSTVTPSTRMNKPEKMLRDSVESFKSGGDCNYATDTLTDVSETLKHSE